MADYPFAVGAAAFPETHIHAVSAEDDLLYLKEKVDAGARFLITQMFFDNRFYFDFVERARAIGIDVPIIPGVMPILSSDGIQRMAQLSAAFLPPQLLLELESRRGNDEAVAELGVAHATLQWPNSSNAAPPGSTSSRSTAPPQPGRSSRRSASPGPGIELRRPCRPPPPGVFRSRAAADGPGRTGAPAPYAVAPASGKLTPVSSSDSSHRRPATTTSLARPLRPTSLGWPRCSWKPSGPT